MSCFWLLNILLLQWLPLARSILETEECSYVGVGVKEDPDIQLTVDCSRTHTLVTWRTPYPIIRLFMMYSCSDVPDVHTKSKFYSGARMGTIRLESIDSNGSCIYSGCVEKIDYGFYIPVLFTNVNCSRTESQSGSSTSQVMSSTYDHSHMETISYSNAIPTPTMMNNHSAFSGIIPTAAFVATTQLPSSVYDMKQLDISPLPASIEAGMGDISKSQLLIILVPSLLLFIASIVTISCIIFSGFTRTRKKAFMKRKTLDKLNYFETTKCIDTNIDSLFFMTAVESSISHSISDVTLLDSLFSPRSKESRKQGKEHKESAQSLNLGVLERGLETERYVLGPKNECLIDWSRASCELAGTSEDGSLMKVAEGFMCIDSFLHKSKLEGGEVVMRTKQEDITCCICEHGSGYESSNQYFNPEDIHHDDLFRRRYQLDGTYYEYNNSSLPSDKCFYSLPQDQGAFGEEEKRMITDNQSGVSHFCKSTSLTGCIGTCGMRKHSKTENYGECEEAVFSTDTVTLSCESFGDNFGVNIVQSLASAPPDDSGFNSNAG